MSTARAIAAAPAAKQGTAARTATKSKRRCACGHRPDQGEYCSHCGGLVVQRDAGAPEIGSVDDPLEREADRAADSVMSGHVVARIDGVVSTASRVQRSAVYSGEPVGSSGRIKTGTLIDWDYVVYADHVRLGNRVFDRNTKQVIGSWPWLTNNPGDITVDPKEAGKPRSNLNRAYEWGAVKDKAASTGHIPLAIFPDGATGAAALKKLYAEPEYRNKTLKAAIEVHLGNPETRVPGVDDPKKYLDRVKERARKLGVSEEVLNKTLADIELAGAMDAVVEGFGVAEGYENVGVTYTCTGRDKTDDAKIPQTVRNLQLFKNLPDQTPDEVLRLLGCKVPSGDAGKAQKKAAEPEDAEDDETNAATTQHESVASALRSPASALPGPVRGLMEHRFGHDFSRVRVHVDATANASARHVGARAYTVGSDIVFAAGEFAPDSQAGQRLISHELTHVVQQTRPGPASSTAALEGEAHSAGDAATTGRGVSPSHAAPPNSLQRDSEPDGPVKVIAKENGMVAVVIMRDGKIVKGLAEIRPPAGVSAQDAASQIAITRGGPSGKVDVIVPPGWGRQTINPAAKTVRVIDTNIEKGEQQKAQVDAQITQLRNNYRQYRNELLIAVGASPDAFGGNDDLDAIAGDKGFLEWVQRKQTAKDYQDFVAQSQGMGFSADQLKDAWKTYRQPGLEMMQADIRRLQGLKYDTEKTLQSSDKKTESILLGWMAGKPKPQEIQAGDGKMKVYLLGLPDGDVVALSEAQFARLRKVAGDKLETKLNTVQNEKGLYQFHKNDRGDIARALDYVYGAKLEGKTWQGIDDSVAASRKALAEGDFEESLARLQDAEQQGGVARREWERYNHYREVGAEVTISGLQVVKTAADVTLAIGTAPMGGWGIVLVTAKGVTETVATAAVKSTGEHVDWGDVGFEVTTQVVTAAVTHGVSKIAPNSAIMNTIRRGLDTPIAGDAVQAIVIDSATFALRQEYEKARGRGEHLTPAQMKDHFLKFVSDPEGLPRQIVEAAAVRYFAPRVAARFPDKKAAGATTGAPRGSEDAGTPQPPGLSHDSDPPLRRPEGSNRPAVDAPATPPAGAAQEPHVNVEVIVPDANQPGKPAAGPEPIRKAGAGGHEVEVTPEKTTVCSPGPCPNLVVEYHEELKTDRSLVAELKEIIELRKTKPGEAAERAVALQTKLERIRTRREMPLGARPVDPAIPQEASARIDAEAHPFELGVGKVRGEAIKAGERDFALDKILTFDIDEPLPVGDKSIKQQRQVARALDPHNRQILDSTTNRTAKGLGVDPRDIQRGRQPLPEVSLTENPNALFTHRFGEVTELKAVFNEAVASIKNPSELRPTELKNTINGKMREIIKTAKSGPGKTIRDVLIKNGFQYGEGVGFRVVEQTPENLLPQSTDAPGAPTVAPGAKDTGPTGVRSATDTVERRAPSADRSGPQSEHDAIVQLEAEQKAQEAVRASAATPGTNAAPPAPAPASAGTAAAPPSAPPEPASTSTPAPQAGEKRSETTGEGVAIKRGTVEPWRKSRSGNVHDLGPGTYYTLDQKVARQYAVERRQDYLKGITPPGATKLPSSPPGIVLETTLNPEGLKIFDFYDNPGLRGEWETYLRKFGPVGEQILSGRGAAQNYHSFFETWMKSKGLTPGDFDVIVGPEYRNAGSQICVRDPVLVEKLDDASRVTEIATDAPSRGAKP